MFRLSHTKNSPPVLASRLRQASLALKTLTTYPPSRRNFAGTQMEMDMTIPVKVFGEYVVCFEAEAEYQSLRSHFVKQCGWTEAQLRKIKNFAWFSAKVTVWKDGKELACEYLGACCYKTEEEFYTVYESDYFSDMVHTCASEIKDPKLSIAIDIWRAAFDANRPALLEAAKAAL
jgi:hypothetical protein